MDRRLGVLVVGCGLIGRRRVDSAAKHSRTKLIGVYDVDHSVSAQVASEYGASAVDSWADALADPAISVVCVATPNVFIKPIAFAALEAGKHVLLEKPMGRNLSEAMDIGVAAERAGRFVKVGFNHRYHPAIAAAHSRVRAGSIGKTISIRARYGHGGRPGYEKEWRGNAEMAGGGELTDQGVHIVDLIHWFAGLPQHAFCYLQTSVWPLHPLEDNAFGLFRYTDGVVVSMHTTWTQWKNLFSFEVFGEYGSLAIEGLGNSYGTERLIGAARAIGGGAPEMEEIVFDAPDRSWDQEWDDFVSSIEGRKPYLGTSSDGIAAMAMIDALYRSARTGLQTTVELANSRSLVGPAGVELGLATNI